MRIDGQGWKSLEYAKLTPYLVQSIQELQVEFNQSLSRQHAEYEAAQRSMAQELEVMRTEMEALHAALRALLNERQGATSTTRI